MSTERVGKAVLDLNLDASGLLAGLDKVKTSSRQTDTEFEKLRQKSIKAGQDLERMVEHFRGDALVAEARRTAQAIDQIGGVGKLTKKELADVSSTVAAATDKLKRMGEEVPPSLRKLSNELATVEQTSRAGGGMLGQFKNVTAALGPILPVASLAGAALGAAIVGVSAAAINAAGDLIDMRDQTGLSTDTLQEMQHVADQTGGSLETWTGNAYKLTLNVAEGSEKARKAAADLGLEWSQLAASNPDQQYNMVIRALEGVTDQNERARLGTAMFGKGFEDMAAAVTSGYTDMAAGARKSTEEQLEALDELGDAWGIFLKGAETVAIQQLGSIAQRFQDTMAWLTLDMAKYTELQQIKIRGILEAEDGRGLSALLRQLEKESKDPPRVPAGRLQAAGPIGLSEKERAKIEKELDAERAKRDKAALDATNSLAEARARLFNTDAIAKAKSYETALGGIGNVTKLTKEGKADLNKVVAEALEAYQALGQQAPQSLRDILAATTPLLTSTRQWQSVLPAAAESAEEALNRVGASLHDLPSETLEETARATTEADAATRAWANATGAVYPPAVREATSATKEFTESTFDAYSALAQMFAQLGQLSGPEGLGTFMRAAGNVIVGLQGARQQAKLVGIDGEILGGRFGALSTVFNANATSSQRMAAGLASAAGVAAGAANIWAVTGQSASKLQNSLSGAMAGAQAGAMFGPWGIAIGAAAGLVTGLVRGKPAWAKAAQEVGRDFGVSISKELAQQIADLAKKEFKGSRQAASVASISSIIKEAGGLNPDNLAQFTGKLRDVFALIEGGQMTAAQGTKVLDENWAAFVAAGTDGQGRLSAGLKEIIRLQQRMGIESQQVTAYLKAQADVIAAGANAVIGATQSQIDQWLKVAKAAKDAAEAKRSADASGQGTPELDKALADANAALASQRANAGQYKQELDDLALIAAGAYHAAIAAGKSHAEAMAAAGPGLAQLKAAYDALGLSVDDAATKSLLMQAELQQRAPTLIAGINGLTQSMIALDNSGRMNAETFAAMQRRASAMFTRIQGELAAAGADMSTNAEALIPMQEYLREAARQAKLLGLPLDENTQMLIDQSKELGIWKEEGEESAETMLDVMTDLRDVMRDFVNDLKGIPREINTRVNVDRNDTGATTQPHPDGGSHRAGIFRGVFPASGARAILHGVESVVPRDQELAFARRVLAERGTGDSTTTNSLNLLPIIMGGGLSPYEIGRQAAAYLTKTGLGTNAQGVTRAIEKVVENYLVTYGAAHGAR